MICVDLNGCMGVVLPTSSDRAHAFYHYWMHFSRFSRPHPLMLLVLFILYYTLGKKIHNVLGAGNCIGVVIVSISL